MIVPLYKLILLKAVKRGEINGEKADLRRNVDNFTASGQNVMILCDNLLKKVFFFVGTYEV